MVQRSFNSQLKKVQEDLQSIRTEFLYNVAEDLIMSSPIDTGTYVRNHSITATTGSGGKQNSYGKPPDDGSAVSDAIDKLVGQINGLSPEETKVYIANRSPYANKVEFGGWGPTPPYRVYTNVESRANNHLKDAINTVKARS
jgi:hypothetical protein